MPAKSKNGKQRGHKAAKRSTSDYHAQPTGKPDITAFWLALSEDEQRSVLTLTQNNIDALIGEAETADDKQDLGRLCREALNDSRLTRVWQLPNSMEWHHSLTAFLDALKDEHVPYELHSYMPSSLDFADSPSAKARLLQRVNGILDFARSLCKEAPEQLYGCIAVSPPPVAGGAAHSADAHHHKGKDTTLITTLLHTMPHLHGAFFQVAFEAIAQVLSQAMPDSKRGSIRSLRFPEHLHYLSTLDARSLATWLLHQMTLLRINLVMLKDSDTPPSLSHDIEMFQLDPKTRTLTANPSWLALLSTPPPLLEIPQNQLDLTSPLSSLPLNISPRTPPTPPPGQAHHQQPVLPHQRRGAGGGGRRSGPQRAAAAVAGRAGAARGCTREGAGGHGAAHAGGGAAHGVQGRDEGAAGRPALPAHAAAAGEGGQAVAVGAAGVQQGGGRHLRAARGGPQPQRAGGGGGAHLAHVPRAAAGGAGGCAAGAGAARPAADPGQPLHADLAEDGAGGAAGAERQRGWGGGAEDRPQSQDGGQRPCRCPLAAGGQLPRERSGPAPPPGEADGGAAGAGGLPHAVPGSHQEGVCGAGGGRQQRPLQRQQW